jgi:thiol-disulfide isomerase/thioredoxin
LTQGPRTSQGLAGLITEVTTVPVGKSVPGLPGLSVSASSASGYSSTLLIDPGILNAVSGAPLTSGGKPEVLYIGAEYCPYCAAERWAMVVALSRFGTFSGLATTHSAAKDGAGNAEPNPNTPTWTFVNTKYSSSDVSFTGVEMETNVPNGSNGYTTLQTPTSAEEALINKWDTAPYIPSTDAGSIPFVDIGNKYMISGASYNGQILGGKTYPEIAAAMKDPSSSIAQGVDGTANYITAALCKVTNNQSTSACTPVVKGLESKL